MITKKVWLIALALGASVAIAGSAAAQYRGYGYSYDGAPDYYYGRGPYLPPDWRDPGAYGDPDDAPRRGPRQSYDYAPPPDRDPGYDQRPPAPPRNAERMPYADPLYGEPRDPNYGPQSYRSDPGGDDDYGPRGGDPNHKASDADLGENANRITRTEVANTTNQPPGVIVINTGERHLYYTQPNGQALQYGIGVGRQGFTWKGTARVERKSEWPDWIPPSDMLKRRPDLPTRMAGGIENPLGARAMYLFQGTKDTMFRIHGTNEPDTIGKAVSSGCIRMNNADVIDLYSRVPVGTKVVVL